MKARLAILLLPLVAGSVCADELKTYFYTIKAGNIGHPLMDRMTDKDFMSGEVKSGQESAMRVMPSESSKGEFAPFMMWWKISDTGRENLVDVRVRYKISDREYESEEIIPLAQDSEIRFDESDAVIKVYVIEQPVL